MIEEFVQVFYSKIGILTPEVENSEASFFLWLCIFFPSHKWFVFALQSEFLQRQCILARSIYSKTATGTSWVHSLPAWESIEEIALSFLSVLFIIWP
jgi:hypothetical protein